MTVKDGIEVIYCAAGSKRYSEIATRYNYGYGAQLPGTTYYPLDFADQDYKRPDFDKYIAALKEKRPRMATVIDHEDHVPIDEVMRWATAASEYVRETVIIIPKVTGAIPRYPHRINGKQVRLGYSVKTKYGSTPVPVWEFKFYPVHLLGGSPREQARIHRYLNAKSADGNYLLHTSNKNMFCSGGTDRYAKNRFWPHLHESVYGRVKKDPLYLAFELSMLNWRNQFHGVSATIRFAVEDDIPQIVKIARQHDEWLGFVMKVALKKAVAKRELYVATYGRRVVAFMNWHKRRDGWHTIYEIAVTQQHQRTGIGAALLRALPEPHRLKCTVDNPANAFYERIGMRCVRTEDGRKRRLNVWETPCVKTDEEDKVTC